MYHTNNKIYCIYYKCCYDNKKYVILIKNESYQQNTVFMKNVLRYQKICNTHEKCIMAANILYLWKINRNNKIYCIHKKCNMTTKYMVFMKNILYS